MQESHRQLFLRTIILIQICIFLIWMLRSSSPSLLLLTYINSCSKSLLESDNYICESDELWNERKFTYKIQDKRNMIKQQHRIYFATNWEPNFHCSHARRVGKIGDGGKWVCDLFRLNKRPDCLIYSAGSNGDFSFEVDLKESMPHCEIHTFDRSFYKCPNGVCMFHQVTFGDGKAPKGSKTWEMIIKELNHTDRSIDIFKIDIEGGEFNFFPVLFESLKNSFPRQVLVEVHPNGANASNAFFELLRANDYVIFNKEPNLLGGVKCFEYAFLKLNSRFFQ
jgi:hypothetical protein